MRPVSTSDRRARDEDRTAAIALVEAAFDDGRIVQMDRDLRVEELRRAQTMTEIATHVRDLAPREETPAPPPPTVNYGPPVSGADRYPTLAEVSAHSGTKLPKALFLIPFAVVLLVALGIVGSLVAVTDLGGSTGGSVAVEEVQPDAVLSEEGYAALVDAVQAESGGTKAFDAVLYPAYAVVSLPVDGRTKRYESWYWNGSSMSTSSKGTASGPRFDLAAVDGAVVVDLVDQVQQLVDDPTSWYAIVRAPDTDGAMIWAYATNDYSETAYLAAKRDGTITYDSTEHD